jgi:hypothetical protein
MKFRISCIAVGFLSLCLSLSAQTASSSTSSSQVPPLIQFSNVATDDRGDSLSGVVNITFSLYAGQQGGEPLWVETQHNVSLDPTGHYSVQLGITKPNGVPTTLFTSGEARWLGVKIAEQGEQPRVLLLSVPYALKAGDAATVGGLPPSAFVLAGQQNGSPSTYVAEAASEQAAPPPGVTDVTTTGGTANYLPLFNGTTTVLDSVLFQSGSGSTAKIGIGNTTPSATLDVTGGATVRGLLNLPAAATATAAAGADSRPFGLVAATYNSSSMTSTNQVFHWQAEPVGNDTSSPSATLNLLFATAPATTAETGLKINSKGQITFATGQSFPGTGDGTITGVTAGTDLTGGGSSGSVTLNLNTSATDLRYSRLGVANTFTGNQTVNGILSATSTVFGMSGTATNTTGLSIGVGGTAASSGGYGVEGVNTSTAGGAGVFGSSASSAGYGVEGAISASSGGTGVYGTAPQFGVYGVATGNSGNTVGVYGNGVDGLQGAGTLHGVYAAAPTYGLYGVATNTSGTDFGVYGSGSSNGVYGIASNFGIYGVATATSGNSVGVYGNGIDGLQGSGTAYGVYAAGTGTSATGVYGTTGTSSGYGVEGVNTSGNGTGVYGTAEHFGVQGIATGTSDTVGVYGSGVDGLQGSGTLHGVYAASSGSGSYGVYSYTPSAGAAGTYGVYLGASATGATWVSGQGGSAGGVWADTNGDNEDYYIPALLATADSDYAAVFANNSDEAPTTFFYNYGTAGTTNALRAEGTAGSCTLTGSGDAACTGTLKSVVATTGSAGARRVETYSMQSPENWFEDFGSGALNNGAATVKLDPTFILTVNTGVEYHVFLTPNGDSKGLYVSQKTATSFEVREQGGGRSSIAFDYRIVAKRVGYEQVRLADVTERFNQQQALSAKMHSARSYSRPSAAPRSIPTMSAPAHPSAAQRLTPLILVPPVLPSTPRPQPVTPRPQSQPVRAALQPIVAVQPK